MQRSAAKSQNAAFLRIENDLGATVSLFLSTNRCPGNAGKELPDLYIPWLKQLSTDNCEGYLSHHCLIFKGIQMLLRRTTAGGVVAEEFSVVLMTRPDLIIYEPYGEELFRDMVVAASRSEPRTIAWPFKCEASSWSGWGCIVDTAIGIPGSEFVAFYEGCLGRIGCHPDATGDKAAAISMTPTLDYNGHACYRCLLLRQRQATTVNPQLRPPWTSRENRRQSNRSAVSANVSIPESEVELGFVAAHIVHDELMIKANAREEGGRNKFYSMMVTHPRQKKTTTTPAPATRKKKPPTRVHKGL